MVAFEIADRMQRNGLRVTTACTLGSPLADRLEAARLPILAVNRKNKYFSPSVVRALRRELADPKYTAVLVEQLNELWQVVPALWGREDLKLVGISHTLVSVSKKGFLHRALYSRVDHLIALTSIHKDNLLARLPIEAERVPVLPNAVDLGRFRPDRRLATVRREYLTDPEREVLIGVVSRVDMGKGLREAIAAAALLKDTGRRFKMIIVGRETIGEEGAAAVLQSDIDRLGLGDTVCLTGHRADIEGLMASLDILLMPSPGETFGRVLIEAMASRVAVVASSGGGVPDIVRDGVNGLLVSPLDVDGMCRALAQLIDSPTQRATLASRGLEDAVQIYDQKQIDQKLYGYLGLV